MKNKILFLLIFTILFNTSFAYADNQDVSVSQQYQVFEYLKKEFEYDKKTDTYYFPVNNFDNLENPNVKSATVAVSGAVISSVLALAVKAGLEFATTNSLSEFVSRFFMLDGISSVVDGLNGAIKSSVGGVINFSKSLLDTIGSKFSELMSNNSVESVYVDGRKFLVVTGTSNPSDIVARYIFENSTLPKVGVDLSQITSTDSQRVDIFDTSIEIPSTKVVGTVSFDFYRKRSYSPYTDNVLVRVKSSTSGKYVLSSSSYALDFSSGTFSKDGVKAYAVPYLQHVYQGEYTLGFVVAIYSTVTGFLEDVQAQIVWDFNIPYANAGTTSPLPVIGSAWSDGKIADNDVSIKVPVDTNQLLNKTPSDVDNPSYEFWKPGITIVPPVIDTGAGDVPKDDVLPPIADDIPGDTETPGDDTTDKPTTSWNWLKELLNSLLDLVRSIIDWLTNFWDNLLDFIISLVVPSEGYWADVFEDILENLKSKIPNVDIDELEQLAVREKSFEDIYATFFGVRCLVVRASVVNEVISWVRPIIQGLIALFLLLYNYNQVYKLIRGGSLVGSTCTNDERGR